MPQNQQHPTDSKARLAALEELLSEGKSSTQDELREELERQHFKVTQSTISRDLRRLGAMKAIDMDGRTVYRLQEEPMPPVVGQSIKDLIIDIQTNGTLIVIHTPPGSASLVARQLDHHRPGGILGTIAGDDTIFVAPASDRDARKAIKAITSLLGLDS